MGPPLSADGASHPVFEGGPLVLDGGLGTLLEQGGHDLSSSLWSARMLLDDPEAIVDAHRQYFRAGARIAISSSYQVSCSGLSAAGIDDEATTRLLRSSVRLAERARGEFAGDGVTRFVAASVGPYGASLADGSEYRGDYGLSVDELRRWHRRRLEVLAGTTADLLAVETIPCLAEVEAICRELPAVGASAWLSVTAASGALRSGESIADAFSMLDDVDAIVAVGVNCTDPLEVSSAVRIARASTAKPIVVYPNSGETWVAARREWIGEPDFPAHLVAEWIDAGASVIGGCCRIGPAQIATIANTMPTHSA